MTDEKVKIYVSGNYRYNRAGTKKKGGVGVWFGSADPRNMSCGLGPEFNRINKVQLKALWVALVLVEMSTDTKVRIYIKNRYTYDIFSRHLSNWKKNNWMNAAKHCVANKEMVQAMAQTIDNIRGLGIDLKIKLATLENEDMDHSLFLAKRASRCYTST